MQIVTSESSCLPILKSWILVIFQLSSKLKRSAWICATLQHVPGGPKDWWEPQGGLVQKLWIYHDLPPRSLGIICLWKKTRWPTILTFGDGMGWRAGTSMVFFPPLPVQFSHRYQLVVKTCQNPGAVFTLKKTWDLWLLIPSNSSSSFDGAWFFCSCFLWSKRCSCGNCRSKKHKKGSTENTGYPLK